MGNEAMTLQTGLQQAKVIQTRQLTHLGSISLMRSQDKQCYLKIFSFSDSFLMQQRLRRFKTRVAKQGSNPHLLQVYQVTKHQKKQLCANNYQLQVYIEYFQETLGQSIAKHLQQRKNYSQEQLYTFMEKVVQSLIYLQDNGLKNIQLDGQAILLCGATVKILDTAVACSKTYFRLLDQREKGINSGQLGVYLAPQLLKDLKQLNYDPYISPKADIFSLGMLLLQMVTLEPMYNYYDYSAATIDYESLIHRLSRISHSLPLKTLLAEMLQHDPEQRIGLVSLKEKVNKIRNSSQEAQTITRSKSSKLLKQILSNSRRRNGLSSRQDSNQQSRPQSTERKNTNRIEVFSSNKKTEEESIKSSTQLIRQSSTKELKKSQQLGRESQTQLNVKNDGCYDVQIQTNIDAAQFKNLVKNRLVKDKNKENSKRMEEPVKKEEGNTADSHFNTDPVRTIVRMETRALLQRKNNKYQPFKIVSQNANKFDKLQSSQNYNKFQSSITSNKLECLHHKATLSKLVQQGGVKSLLKLQHLDSSNFIRSNKQSMKNTSRFGQAKQQNNTFNASSANVLNSYRVNIQQSNTNNKKSDIYIKQDSEIQQNSISEHPFITAREKTHNVDRQLSKVMTFNNKQFIVQARTIDPPTNQEIKPLTYNDQKLTFSPITTPKGDTNYYYQSCQGNSPQLTINIDNIPVVISQEKVCHTETRGKFSKLQRQLNLMDVAQSIQQDTMSNYSSNLNNTSKVIQSFKPHLFQQSKQISQISNYDRDGSSFFKKQKPKKPMLNLQLQTDYFSRDRNPKQSIIHQYDKNTQPPLKSKLDIMYKTSRSIEHLSNFTSISPPHQDFKDSNSTYHHLFPNKEDQNLLNKKTLPNGDVYEGELNSDGEMQGNGTVYSFGGVRYRGSFSNGVYCGFGILFNLNHSPFPVDDEVDFKNIDMGKANWIRYEGQFGNGKKNGFGTIYFSNGEKFSGCLKQDVIEGYGCFYKKNGVMESGFWSDNKFNKFKNTTDH